jgi:catechol 2,3-dioxygenase-like lactoylglutathione lyase family enzyme
MFDHIKFGVSDYAASKAFYQQALAPLGVAVVDEGAPDYGLEMAGADQQSLCLFQTSERPAHLHIAFKAASRAQVDAFYQAALAAGARDNGAPGLRPQYSGRYYAAFVIGPDGHNLEAVFHAPVEGRGIPDSHKNA